MAGVHIFANSVRDEKTVNKVGFDDENAPIKTTIEFIHKTTAIAYTGE